MPLWLVLLSAVALVGVLYLIVKWFILLPSARDMVEVNIGLRQIQKGVCEKLRLAAESEPGTLKPGAQSFHASAGVALNYAVVPKEGQYRHRVLMKLTRLQWYRKRAIWFSLTAFMVLTEQFSELFSDEETPKVDFTDNGAGSIQLEFALSGQQHEAFRSKLASDSGQ